MVRVRCEAPAFSVLLLPLLNIFFLVSITSVASLSNSINNQLSSAEILSSPPCDQEACRSQVSKCMLLKACSCAMTPSDFNNKNCPCCKQCIQCLGKHLHLCCACVGLCRAKEPPGWQESVEKRASEVEDLNIELDTTGLFEQFAVENNNWSVYTFPKFAEVIDMKVEMSAKKVEREVELPIKGESLSELDIHTSSTNCTVIYTHSCIPRTRCRNRCRSIGAAMLRWFTWGCCECISPSCLPYGSRDSRCRDCKHPDLRELGMGNGEL